jgi:hypothetical protein
MGLKHLQFDSKPDDPYESDSDDVDESLTVPAPGENVRVSAYETVRLASFRIG